jgi:head-tail adaptor
MEALQLEVNREAIENNFSSTAYVLENTPVSDGMSGTTDSWGLNGRSYACTIQESSSSREKQESDRNVSGGALTVHLPWNAQVSRDKRLRINGVDYVILGTNEEVSNRASLIAICERL